MGITAERRQLTPEELKAAAEFRRLVNAMPDSQHTLGAAIGVSQGMIWQWADGKVAISAAKARAAAKAVGGDPFKISVAFREVVGDPAELLGHAGPASASTSQPAQLNPGKVGSVARALRIFIQRRNPQAVLDLEDPIDAELFCLAYAELMKMGDADGVAVGAVIADLMTAREERRNARNRGNDGPGEQPTAGTPGGKARKSTAG